MGILPAFRPALVVDLDDTLLHDEPEAIAVQGRSGFRYLSATAANLLRQISSSLPPVIATARNAQSVKRLVDQLPEVRFGGFVMENGLVARTRVLSTVRRSNPWQTIADTLSDWEQLRGYESCLGLIPPRSLRDAKEILAEVLLKSGLPGQIYVDRHKLFIYPCMPGKLTGVRSLQFQPWVALGDGLNDLETLRASRYVATLSTADEAIKRLVILKGGYCSPRTSHAATEDLLSWVLKVIRTH